MPLIKSSTPAAFSQNVSEMIKSGHPRASALAAAYRIRRGYANGGMPFAATQEARGLVHAGAIHGITGGRADRIPMKVGANSYILPADVISGVGGGNSNAGSAAFNKLFKMGPYGSGGPKIGAGRSSVPKIKLADGGDTGEGVDILASDGEFAVPAEKVAEIGGGDIKRGHEILDEMVKHIRAKTIKKLKSLPSPKKS